MPSVASMPCAGGDECGVEAALLRAVRHEQLWVPLDAEQEGACGQKRREKGHDGARSTMLWAMARACSMTLEP